MKLETWEAIFERGMAVAFGLVVGTGIGLVVKIGLAALQSCTN